MTIPGLLVWSVHMQSTFASRMLTKLAGLLPESAWTNRSMLGVIGRIAGMTLGAGDIRLAGAAPNGQHFMVAPRKVWDVSASRAVLRGEDLGPIGRLAEQARLADFRPPQRGICVIGTGHFENFDETAHIRARDAVLIG